MKDSKKKEPSMRSLQIVAQVWQEPETENITMDTALAVAFAKLLDKYIDALIWCSGSDDFAQGGKAVVGWHKICKPLIDV